MHFEILKKLLNLNIRKNSILSVQEELLINEC